MKTQTIKGGLTEIVLAIQRGDAFSMTPAEYAGTPMEELAVYLQLGYRPYDLHQLYPDLRAVYFLRIETD